jgi:membrane protease subunit HflC
MKNTIVVLVVIAIVGVIFVALGPFYVVDEGFQAVVVRFGAIVNSTETAGLKLKLPIIDTVVKYPNKILSWDGDARKIPTAENQFIWVDSTARWRIVDPELFYSSVTTFERAYLNLDDVIDSSVKSIIANNSLVEAVRSSNIINESAGEVIGGLDDDVSLEGLKDFTTEQVNFEQIEKGRGALSDDIESLVERVVRSTELS